MENIANLNTFYLLMHFCYKIFTHIVYILKHKQSIKHDPNFREEAFLIY